VSQAGRSFIAILSSDLNRFAVGFGLLDLRFVSSTANLLHRSVPSPLASGVLAGARRGQVGISNAMEGFLSRLLRSTEASMKRLDELMRLKQQPWRAHSFLATSSLITPQNDRFL